MFDKTTLLLATLCLCLASSCQQNEPIFNPAAITAANGWFIAETAVDYDALKTAVEEANDETVSGIPDALWTDQLQAALGSLHSVEACETDDTYFFVKDGPVEYSPGPETCDEQDDFAAEQIFEGSTGWLLSEESLTIDMEGESYVYELVKFNSSIMILRATEMFSVDVLDVCVKRPIAVEVVLCTR